MLFIPSFTSSADNRNNRNNFEPDDYESCHSPEKFKASVVRRLTSFPQKPRCPLICLSSEYVDALVNSKPNCPCGSSGRSKTGKCIHLVRKTSDALCSRSEDNFFICSQTTRVLIIAELWLSWIASQVSHEIYNFGPLDFLSVSPYVHFISVPSGMPSHQSDGTWPPIHAKHGSLFTATVLCRLLLLLLHCAGSPGVRRETRSYVQLSRPGRANQFQTPQQPVVRLGEDGHHNQGVGNTPGPRRDGEIPERGPLRRNLRGDIWPDSGRERRRPPSSSTQTIPTPVPW